jgi:hypothetical protein
MGEKKRKKNAQQTKGQTPPSHSPKNTLGGPSYNSSVSKKTQHIVMDKL